MVETTGGKENKLKIRIIKDYKEYKKNEVVDVTPNVAHGLIESGIARVDRMYTVGREANLK